MKKTTIALLTAAAMGTSGAVMAANHGPEVSGRINLDIRNVEGNSTEFTRGNPDRVIFSGSGDLAHGLTGSYLLRFQSDNEGEFSTNKAFYTVSGDFGEVQFGRDGDDIVYRFVGVRTDLPWANLGGVADAAATGDTTNSDDVSLQYHMTVDALSFGAYVDTSDGEFDEDDFERTGDGFNTYQLGVQGDFGMVSAGVVYSDSDFDGRESELAFGVTLDLDVATIGATVRDDSKDNTPVSVAGFVPLQNGLGAYASYGDDDDGFDNFLLGVSADLGGGLVTYVEYQDKLDEDNDSSGFVLGANYSF